MNARTLKGVRAAPVATAPVAAAPVATALVAALLTFSALPPSAAAQARAQPRIARVEEGVVGAGLLMRQLDGVKRVLMIGAHPDDEDTALLATLARGWGVETAYLALTRGDGGQNLIGNELFEGLGVVRTGELLSARGLDGGVQFFTRAYDFGYSKTADEALALWPREELLRDVTWVVRSFRPQVIVSVFSGTEADGHGQHQASGIMANDVFDVAGDATRYPLQLAMGVEPWQPLKLLRRPRGPGAETTLEVSTGSFDPLLGRSHFQLAMESRSQHRSQDMGQGQTPGPRSTVLQLVKAAPGLPADVAGQGFFAGVDTTLAGLAEAAGASSDAAARTVAAYREALHEASASLDVLDPVRSAPPLARALQHLDALLGEVSRARGNGSPAAADLARRRERVQRALLTVAGVVTVVRVDDDLVVPGESVDVSVDVWNGGPLTVAGARAVLAAPAGWRVEPVEPPGSGRAGGPPSFFGRGGLEAASHAREVDIAPGDALSWRFRVTLPPDADLTRLYYLERPRDGEMYRWPGEPELWARPKAPPPLSGGADFALAVSGTPGGLRPSIAVRREGEYVGVVQDFGEFRRPVLVVPAVAVEATPSVLVWPLAAGGARQVSVALTGFASREVRGTVSLEAPAGWSVEPGSRPFELRQPGEEQSFTFTVRSSGIVSQGRHEIRAVARTVEGDAFTEAVDLVDYPHIARTAMFRPAVAGVTAVDVRVRPNLRVGYVMGTGDVGYDAIREMGVAVELLGPDDVRSGDLSRFDVLVLGIRAYEARPDVVASNDRILGFARDGGTVVVQYGQYQYPGYAPYDVAISRPHDRVTDERSPVRFLEPDHPALTTPNRIVPADFEGWITERGLYFLGTWDRRFTPVIEFQDPGEEPKRGALMVAPLGEGLYVYTGISFFRQLQEGVPGAYRLFANLISLKAGDGM